MPLVSSSIPNLVNGVSQQPFTLRLSSQAEEQTNGLSTTSQGLRKRPPTKHLKKILSGSLGDAYLHTINRDPTEQYVVIITDGNLKVFDLDGTEKTVSFPDGTTYLDSASPSTSFRAVTVADYTFIVNKNTTVTQRADKSADRAAEALINVKVGNYGQTYKVIINNTTVSSYTTPDGSNSSHTANINTDFIATQLVSNGLSSLSGYTVIRTGSTIYISKTSGDFLIRAEDGFNNGAMTALKGQIQKFSDLPAQGRDGFKIEVIGDKNFGFDNFWVKFDGSGTGAWVETIAPDEFLGFEASTMPHQLVRNADGTFTFEEATWDDRTVGDLNLNPDPSFVGSKINDIFFYRNRLGFLSDEGVIMSEAGEFFNFYRKTVTELLDSAPIDVQASHTKVSTLVHAIPYNRQLLLFSAQTQFIVDTQQDILTPQTVAVKQSTEFEANVTAAPVGFGNNIYFAVDKGEYSGLREYFTIDEVAGTNDAADVTSHVPSYIPAGVTKIAAGLNNDILAVLTPDDPSSMYIYNFYWSNNEKLQSAWSKWTLDAGDEILNVDFILSDMFLVIQRSDGVYLEKLSVAIDDIWDEEPYTVHLDRKVIISGADITFDGTYSNIALADLPCDLTDGEWQAVVAKNQTLNEGILVDVEQVAAGGRIEGDFSGNDIILGRKYSHSYTFSPIVVRTASGNAQKADTTGRLQVRNLQLNFSDTGYFKAIVTPTGRSSYEYIFSGKTVGLSSSTIGDIALETGLFKFPVLAKNTEVSIQVTNDTPLPSALLSADWEGMYVKRSKAV